MQVVLGTYQKSKQKVFFFLSLNPFIKITGIETVYRVLIRKQEANGQIRDNFVSSLLFSFPHTLPNVCHQYCLFSFKSYFISILYSNQLYLSEDYCTFHQPFESISVLLSNILLHFLDGDLITIFDSSDLLFAIQYSHVLKLKIFPHYDDSGCGSLNNNVYLPPHLQSIRQDLRFIQGRVNALLETLDNYSYNTGGYPSLDHSTGEHHFLINKKKYIYFDLN